MDVISQSKMPPAIPIAISGEEITKEMIQAFQSFQLEKVSVVKE